MIGGDRDSRVEKRLAENCPKFIAERSPPTRRFTHIFVEPSALETDHIFNSLAVFGGADRVTWRETSRTFFGPSVVCELESRHDRRSLLWVRDFGFSKYRITANVLAIAGGQSPFGDSAVNRVQRQRFRILHHRSVVGARTAD